MGRGHSRGPETRPRRQDAAWGMLRDGREVEAEEEEGEAEEEEEKEVALARAQQRGLIGTPPVLRSKEVARRSETPPAAAAAPGVAAVVSGCTGVFICGGRVEGG